MIFSISLIKAKSYGGYLIWRILSPNQIHQLLNLRQILIVLQYMTICQISVDLYRHKKGRLKHCRIAFIFGTSLVPLILLVTQLKNNLSYVNFWSFFSIIHTNGDPTKHPFM